MKNVIINSYEKVASQDFNDIQSALQQYIQDKVLRPLFNNADGFIRGGFLASRTNSTTVAIAAGTAFIQNAGVSDPLAPKYQAILTTGFNVSFVAPSTGQHRRDIISVKSASSVTSTASRYVKAGGTGSIALETVDKISEVGYSHVVTAGTPAGSSGAATRPATPAGYIVICEVYSDDAGVNVSGLTDLRNVLTAP